MSDALSDRGKGFERKYQLDQDQEFRAQVRRDKLFGVWVGAKLGHAGAAADAYAQEVAVANMDKPGDDDMLGKVRADLTARGIQVPDAELMQKLTECHNEAAKQILAEKK
jgi:hypothetical protein